MERREWKREASNGLGKIYNVLWQEESLEKKGILFVLHGMQGHIGKYRYLFEYMAKQGYVVCGMDIQGHGKSANIPGYFGDNSGWESIIHDIHRSLLQIKNGFRICRFFFLAIPWVPSWQETMLRAMGKT